MADTAIKDLGNLNLSYNGVEFGQFASVHLRATPEYDRAGRTTTCVRYTLSVRSIEYDSDETSMSSTLLEKRRKLLEAGKRLVIKDIGFGDTATNENHPDIIWGPQPKDATFKPLGGGICWQLDWVCEFRVTECAAAGVLKGTGSKPFMAFNFDVTYSNDELGFTTRTINGSAQIPQPRNAKLVHDVPLNYRDKIFVQVPVGFRRIRNEWRESAAQNELSFMIVDEQMRGEAPPAGLARAEVNVGLSARAEAGLFHTWIFSVSGTLETLPGFPKALAAAKFFQIVYSYGRALQRTVGSRAFIYPIVLEMRHGAFGRASSFTSVFQVCGAQDLDIFSAGTKVLYSPLPDSSYASWSQSTFGTRSLGDLWSAGGQSKLRTTAPDIIDLCNATKTVSLLSSANLYPLSGAFPDGGPASYYSGATIRPETSWVAYEPSVRLRRADQVYVNKRDAKIKPPTSPTGSPADALKGTKTSPYTPYEEVGDTLSQCGAPEQLLVFSGKAVRMKWPVTLPKLAAIEGVKLDWIDGETESVRGPSLVPGMAAFYGRWTHVYRPQRYLPGTVLEMPHPQIELA